MNHFTLSGYDWMEYPLPKRRSPRRRRIRHGHGTHAHFERFTNTGFHNERIRVFWYGRCRSAHKIDCWLREVERLAFHHTLLARSTYQNYRYRFSGPHRFNRSGFRCRSTRCFYIFMENGIVVVSVFIWEWRYPKNLSQAIDVMN